MRYVQLRAFHHVARCGGFSRAASYLCLTQPAVSDQIRRLEVEYDTVLFDRSGHRTTLTVKGRQLFDHTSRLFEAEDRAREFLTDTRAQLSGQLRLIVDSVSHVTGILGAFQASHPGVRVLVRTGNTEAVVRSLTGYQAEIGVGGNFPANARLEMTSLSEAPVIAVVSADHPLAGRGQVAFPDLANHPLILREEGSKTRQVIEGAAKAAGLSLVGALEVEGREAVRDLAAAGLGVGFVSAGELAADSRLATIDIKGSQLVMEEMLVFLAARRDSPMIRSFIQFARHWVQQPPAGTQAAS